ncbi:MAG: hypothetical protein MJZ38_04620 [archaeon]|nr:hypothetical protein [archaeon]
MAETVATRREMTSYDKGYRFTVTPGMRAFAYSEGDAHEVKGESICAKDIPAKGFLRKKEFYLVEIAAELDLVFPCRRFGLSKGVLVRMRPCTTPRSVAILLLKYGKTRAEGRESITTCDTDDMFDLLQESFDEAVDRTPGEIDDVFFEKLVENINRTGEFANFGLEAYSASRSE